MFSPNFYRNSSGICEYSVMCRTFHDPFSRPRIPVVIWLCHALPLSVISLAPFAHSIARLLLPPVCLSPKMSMNSFSSAKLLPFCPLVNAVFYIPSARCWPGFSAVVTSFPISCSICRNLCSIHRFQSFWIYLSYFFVAFFYYLCTPKQ